MIGKVEVSLLFAMAFAIAALVVALLDSPPRGGWPVWAAASLGLFELAHYLA